LVKRLVAVCVCAGLLSGCTPAALVICEPLEEVYAGDLTAAVLAIDKTAIADTENDRFLYRAQRGHLLHLGGEFEKSNHEFELAAAVAEELEPLSITGTITDYTFNETVKAYPGEDFERAYLHYYMTLNYLMLDDLEGALIECRRLDEVFRKLDARYEEGTDRYQDDGFIRYLSGLIYEALGKQEDAFIDYLLAARAYEGESGLGASMGVPQGLVESFVWLGRRLGREDDTGALVDTVGVQRPVPAGMGEIVVVIDSGWAPYKLEESIEFPIYSALVPEDFRGSSYLAAYVKIAYPVFESVPWTPDGFRVGATRIGARDGEEDDAGGQSSSGRGGLAMSSRRVEHAWAERVQDIDALARWTLERRIGAIKLRSTLRATTKQIALAKAKHDREEKRKADNGKDDGFGASLLRWIVEDVVTRVVAETEQADTRSWITLPAGMWIARIPVEPGEYDVKIAPEGMATPVVLGRVTVPPGGKAFRAARVLGGPHPVRCD
jgi:hypothetical protein